MALSFADAPGNLFNRLGKLGALLKQVRLYQAALKPIMIDTTTGVVAQYNNEPDIQAVMGSSYISLLNGVPGGIPGTIQDIAALTINRMVFRDNPKIAQNLESVNLYDSLTEVIKQMKAQGASVLAQTITATPTTFTGTGNGVINASAKRPFDGLTLENAFAENLLFTVSSDSYSGTANAGNESVTVTGVGATGLFNFDWPLGSNTSNTIRAIDGEVDTGSGNILTNSGFESWTNNVPDNWELVVGTAGTNIEKESSIVFGGSAALKMNGDAGGTLTQIRQKFATSAGTTEELSYQTQYSVCLFIRRDGNPPHGELTVELTDGNGTVVQDNAGVNNSFTCNLTTLTTVFTAFKGVFRTPTIMPSEMYIRIRVSNALHNNKSIYIDKMSLGEMTQLYASGPFVAVHSGAVPFAIDDFATCQITNSRGAGGTLNTFQTLMAELVPSMFSNELLLPSSAIPSISDTLIA